MSSKVETHLILKIFTNTFKLGYHSMFLDDLYLELSCIEDDILCEMFPDFKDKRIELLDLADEDYYMWGQYTRKPRILIN